MIRVHGVSFTSKRCLWTSNNNGNVVRLFHMYGNLLRQSIDNMISSVSVPYICMNACMQTTTATTTKLTHTSHYFCFDLSQCSRLAVLIQLRRTYLCIFFVKWSIFGDFFFRCWIKPWHFFGRLGVKSWYWYNKKNSNVFVIILVFPFFMKNKECIKCWRPRIVWFKLLGFDQQYSKLWFRSNFSYSI